MQKTGAVIAAAGLSSRMGDFKPLLKLGNMTVIERVIVNYKQAGIFPIVVVTGFKAKELEKQISKLGVVCLRNERYEETEMFDSAKIGFSYLVGKCERTFFSPADIPLFSSDTLVEMLRSNAEVVRPVFQNKCGHPIMIREKVLDTIISGQYDGGLREALTKNNLKTEYLSVYDEGILLDMDTPKDYQRVLKAHNRKLYRPSIEISLVKEGKMFDSTVSMLLHMIQYSGTVKDACEKMGISYSKAWKMLKELEKNIGFPLIERLQGGETGGESYLTKEGQELLDRYDRYVKDVKKYAETIFGKYMQGDDWI